MKKMSFKKKLTVIALTVIVLGVLGVLAYLPRTMLGSLTGRHMEVEVYSPTAYGITATELELKTDDDLKLVSWLTDVESPKGVVILLSGIEKPSVTAFFNYAKLLKDNGYASLLIEMRAHGKSEGESVALGMLEWMDVKAGVDYLKSKDEFSSLPIIVWGTSMGAATAINATGRIPEIDGLISFSAYSSVADIFADHMIGMGLPKLLATVEKPFINLNLGLLFGFRQVSISPINEIQKLKGRPALIMHSKGDTQVPFASFERLMEKADDSVQTYTREGDYHFIYSDPDLHEGDTEITNIVLQFLKDHFE